MQIRGSFGDWGGELFCCQHHRWSLLVGMRHPRAIRRWSAGRWQAVRLRSRDLAGGEAYWLPHAARSARIWRSGLWCYLWISTSGPANLVGSSATSAGDGAIAS